MLGTRQGVRGDKMIDMRNAERWIVGALLCVALLTFFFPLVSLQVPIIGSQEVSGYDLVSKAKGFSQTLAKIKSGQQPESSLESSQPATTDPNSTQPPPQSSLPLSVQTLAFVPIEIGGGFLFAVIALLCCLGGFSSTSAKAVSIIGGLSAVAAIIHLAVANSDLHSFMAEQMRADSSATDNNVLAGLAQQVAKLAMNSVQLKPGAGLYVLAGCLSVAAIILLSRLLATSPSSDVEMIEPVDEPNGQTRTVVFVLLAIGVVVAAVFVVRDKIPPPPPLVPVKGAFDGDFSAKKALTALVGNYDPSHRSSSVVRSRKQVLRSTCS